MERIARGAALNTEQASEYLGGRPAKKTLVKMRTTGGGPKYVQLGRSVVYYTRDLDQWVESSTRHSTSEVAAK